MRAPRVSSQPQGMDSSQLPENRPKFWDDTAKVHGFCNSLHTFTVFAPFTLMPSSIPFSHRSANSTTKKKRKKRKGMPNSSSNPLTINDRARRPSIPFVVLDLLDPRIAAITKTARTGRVVDPNVRLVRREGPRHGGHGRQTLSPVDGVVVKIVALGRRPTARAVRKLDGSHLPQLQRIPPPHIQPNLVHAQIVAPTSGGERPLRGKVAPIPT